MFHRGSALHDVFLCRMRALAWWLGKTSVSATTTFSRLVAAKTTTSAISSGVNGSQPLEPSLVKTHAI